MSSVNRLTKRETLALYVNMLKIRLAEEMISQKYLEGEIRLAIHLCIGEEAVAAGVCENLQKGDYIFSNHRSHGHYIAGNGDLNKLFAELYGKAGGCSSGKGGSMHLFDSSIGYLGSSSIVGGNIPIAVGTGLASKCLKLPRVTVCFFGDGAADEGTFYEALNFAAIKSLPVLFVCENNFYAIFSNQKVRQKLDNIYRRYREMGVPGIRVDGNDAIKVYEVSKHLIEGIRNGQGPFLMECRTYRWMAHAGPSPDNGLGYRSDQDIKNWRRKCPIQRLENYMLNHKIVEKNYLMRIHRKVSDDIKRAVLYAQNSEYPQKEDLLKDIMSVKKVTL
jgi:TPP-dependent pyruvate/acetoin dehydrogenase alpha subunit